MSACPPIPGAVAFVKWDCWKHIGRDREDCRLCRGEESKRSRRCEFVEQFAISRKDRAPLCGVVEIDNVKGCLQENDATTRRKGRVLVVLVDQRTCKLSISKQVCRIRLLKSLVAFWVLHKNVWVKADPV